MKENINKIIQWVLQQPVKGCITGSCLLGVFENQDIDIFLYDEKSFNKILFAMHHNSMFLILNKLEQWKFDQYINKNKDNYSKQGIITIKFYYNTCIPVNIILKKGNDNIFSILSSFDINIICKGIDIQTGKELDLTEDSTINKIASWNKWNTSFYNPELWEMNRILRQLERVFKYYKRGYNTDLVVLKYIEIINSIQELEDIFSSTNYTERLKINKENTKIIKQICEIWLEKHEISDKELELLKLKIKEI